MSVDYRELFTGLQDADKRARLSADELSACEREVIRLMRLGAKAKILPLITLQFTGSAWKIYESRPKDISQR